MTAEQLNEEATRLVASQERERADLERKHNEESVALDRQHVDQRASLLTRFISSKKTDQVSEGEVHLKGDSRRLEAPESKAKPEKVSVQDLRLPNPTSFTGMVYAILLKNDTSRFGPQQVAAALSSHHMSSEKSFGKKVANTLLQLWERNLIEKGADGLYGLPTLSKT